MKKILTIIIGFFATVTVAGLAQAGPGSVEVQTLGDITIRMGAQVRLVPTQEVSRDFGVSSTLSSSEEATAAAAMRSLGGGGGNSTKTHLNEAGGAVKDGYIRGENRLFFNFAHDQDWDVYFALESDTTLDRSSADRTDFAIGKQSQQFGIERLEATFNLPWINSRLEGGWDVRGADVKFGGLVYGDDDPHIGIAGCAQGFDWAVRYTKKDESEAGYYLDNGTNAIGAADQKTNVDRTFYWGTLGYNFKDLGTYVQGFYFYDDNMMTPTGDYPNSESHRNFIGINYKGQYGIFKPLAEFVYNTGKYVTADDNRDYNIDAYAMFADLAVDLKQYVPAQQFEVHVGGYYVSGDHDTSDHRLTGFAPAVGISRFSPRFGSEQSISFDGNPVLGQILYSMLPAYYGTVRGGGINGGAALDNPGFEMIGGGLKTKAYGVTYITHAMAMWFNDSTGVEAYYMNQGLAGVDGQIDDFMGVEWNNEVRYNIYKNVTLKGGAAFFFPGSGAKDITKALNAIGRGVTYDQGKKSDDVSMRFAAELLWFF